MEKKKDPAGVQRVTLKDLGAKLPVMGGSLACRPWRMKEEREIGAAKVTHKGAEFIAEMFALMLTKLGKHDFETMKHNERALVARQLTLGDALYAYVWLRRQCVGGDVQVTLTCPACGHEASQFIDLDDLDVRLPAPESPGMMDYALKIPVEIRGQKAHVFHLGQLPFDLISKAKRSAAVAQIVAAAVHNIDDRPATPLTYEEIDELAKVDVDGLTDAINRNALGPDFTIEGRCERCSTAFLTSIDWSFDSFFTTSSRPTPGTG